MGPLAKDIIQRLLIKDPKKRLGSGLSGAQDVKSHPFYQARNGINPIRNIKVEIYLTQGKSLLQLSLRYKHIVTEQKYLCLIQKINWEDLAAKKVPAPFKPVIRDELDVSNFAEEFTEMDPTYSPAALPQNCDRIFQVRVREPDFSGTQKCTV